MKNLDKISVMWYTSIKSKNTKQEKKMKLIEALKKMQDLQKKADDLREKVSKHSAYLSYETPVYSDQKKQVSEWIQAHGDILKEILRLRIAIQKTNLAVDVTIEIDGEPVTKTIAEWIHRRRDLAASEEKMWRQLTDRGLKEGVLKQSTGENITVTIVRCYDPEKRDKNIDLFNSEPTTIDAKLETVNAVTDLIE